MTQTNSGFEVTHATSPSTRYIVEVWNGRRWAKVRGHEGGPWLRRDRAERMARARENESPRDLSSTAGQPHRVVER